MKRLVIALSLSLTMVGLPLQGNADQRITFQPYRSLVVMGYGSVLTPVITQVSEASTYDWGSFKYEIVTEDDIAVSASYRVLQSNLVSCSGTLSGSGNLSACSGSVTTGRQVVNGGTAQSSIPNAGITLTGYSSKQFEARVTAWLDLNHDGHVSPLEPKSAPALITFIPAKELSATLNFEVDPPGNHTGGISGWIYDSSGREAWGRGLSSVLDLSKFLVYVERCVGPASPCSVHSYSPVLVSHPQLQAYRFAMQDEWSGNARTKVSLAYQEFTESFTVLGVQSFDYAGPVPSSASTEIVAPRNSAAPILGVKPKAHERLTYLSDQTAGFVYRARFFDGMGKPMAREVVDIKIDSSDYPNSSQLSVDDRGLSLSSGDARDVIWIQRVTDDDGLVEIHVKTSLPTLWQSVGIESQLRGHEAHRGGRGGYLERVIWQPSPRSFSLDVAQSTANELLVTAKLVGPVTYGANLPIVQFVSSPNLIFGESVARMTGTATSASDGVVSYQSRLRVKWSSFTAGREFVRAKVNIAGVWYQAEQEIEFNGRLGTLKKPSTEISESASVSPEVNAVIGSYGNRIAIRVLNAKGSSISVKVGSRWFKYTALNDNYLYRVASTKGRNVPVTVYVDGILETVATITVK